MAEELKLVSSLRIQAKMLNASDHDSRFANAEFRDFFNELSHPARLLLMREVVLTGATGDNIERLCRFILITTTGESANLIAGQIALLGFCRAKLTARRSFAKILHGLAPIRRRKMLKLARLFMDVIPIDAPMIRALTCFVREFGEGTSHSDAQTLFVSKILARSRILASPHLSGRDLSLLIGAVAWLFRRTLPGDPFATIAHGHDVLSPERIFSVSIRAYESTVNAEQRRYFRRMALAILMFQRWTQVEPGNALAWSRIVERLQLEPNHRFSGVIQALSVQGVMISPDPVIPERVAEPNASVHPRALNLLTPITASPILHLSRYLRERSADRIIITYPGSGGIWLNVLLNLYLFGDDREGLDLYRKAVKYDARPRIFLSHGNQPHLLPVEQVYADTIRAVEAMGVGKSMALVRDPVDTAISSIFQRREYIPGVADKSPSQDEIFEALHSPVGGIASVLEYQRALHDLVTNGKLSSLAFYEDFVRAPETALKTFCDNAEIAVDGPRLSATVDRAGLKWMRYYEHVNYFQSCELSPLDPANLLSFRTRSGRVGAYRSLLKPEQAEAMSKQVALAQSDSFNSYKRNRTLRD